MVNNLEDKTCKEQPRFLCLVSPEKKGVTKGLRTAYNFLKKDVESKALIFLVIVAGCTELHQEWVRLDVEDRFLIRVVRIWNRLVMAVIMAPSCQRTTCI